MKYMNYIAAVFTIFAAGSLNAQLIIEDFESYTDTGSLQADVFSFGSAAQAGKPSLAVGLGENASKAACFSLTWQTGNNANLSFINLSPNTQNLSGYSEIDAFVFIEVSSNPDGPLDASAQTLVKLAIEGIDGSIWQTRSVKAEKPPVDASYKLRFNLSRTDMVLIDGTASFEATISNIKNLRLRFENSKISGFKQYAYIDSITAVQ